MAKATRGKTKIYLIGYDELELKGSKLPSCREVLAVFFHHHKTCNMTVRDSTRLVIREAVGFWNKARIPTLEEQRAIEKMERLFQCWVNLKKNAKRETSTQRENERKFVETLDRLFDIARPDALDVMTIMEDKKFLVAQRQEVRIGHMEGVDMTLAAKEIRKVVREKITKKRKDREELRKENSGETAVLESSTSSSDDESDDAAIPVRDLNQDLMTVYAAAATVAKKRGRINIITPELSDSLDRNKISDRKAVYVLAATAESLGHSVDDININRSSIRRHRNRAREEGAKALKENFKSAGTLVVHWDGKMLPALTGKKTVDRLAVVVTGRGVHQLLGIPKLAAGTGEGQASAVAELLRDWKLAELVKGICFDTTATNTGRVNGACVILERLLDKNLLYFACRHHIFEIILEAIFVATMGPSSGPDIALFKRFQQAWSQIDIQHYETGITNEAVTAALGDREVILTFALSQLQIAQRREDYRELLELVIIFLGAVPPRGLRFRLPGALHRARWMAKGLYTLKIWMFRGQFRLTANEERGLREFCVFLVRVYINSWFTAPIASSAPRNDITFVKNVLKYKEVNPALSQVALRKFSNHLWYLSEELIALSFYDPNISSEMKRKMVHSLSNGPSVEFEPDLTKNRKIDIEKCAEITIADLVTPRTMVFFERLGVSSDFLDYDPALWGDREDFRHGMEIVKNLMVVNDHAERGVALIQEFNSSITKHEEQKQYLLQVVQEHRNSFPNAKKTTINGIHKRD